MATEWPLHLCSHVLLCCAVLCHRRGWLGGLLRLLCICPLSDTCPIDVLIFLGDESALIMGCDAATCASAHLSIYPHLYISRHTSHQNHTYSNPTLPLLVCICAPLLFAPRRPLLKTTTPRIQNRRSARRQYTYSHHQHTSRTPFHRIVTFCFVI